jgi:hypothetical protein
MSESTTERRDSVSLAVAVTAHYRGIADNLTNAEVAEKINMSEKSLAVKISQARKQLRVSTSIFADPSDPKAQINGVDLMTRLKLDPAGVDKAVKAGKQKVLTVGTIIPSLKSSGQRSTGGAAALVDLVAALTGPTETDAGDKKEKPAESNKSQ